MRRLWSLACFASLLFVCSPLLAGGFKGGGGARGGGARGGGRPASMPHMGGGGARPSMPMNRPTVSRPSISPPAQRPSLPSTRPSMPAQRPTMPTTRPSMPTTRPSLPNGGMKPTLPSQRPSPLPGNIPSRPNPSNRPAQLPSQRPSTLPGQLPNRPNAPSTRPSMPNLGGTQRPSTRPGNTRPGNIQPGARPPSAGDLGDFLGIDGGLRPNAPTTRPGGSGRPNVPDIANRPNVPNDLPVGIPGRVGGNSRPINVGQINVGNTVINNRPTWANIDNRRISTINNRWQTQVGGLHNWPTRYPARIGYWNSWGGSVRVRWNGHHYHNRWFAGDWWYSHPGGVCRWHYYHRFNAYPWNYWWRRPAWGVTAAWFVWSAPATVWSQPVYYDYGTGGNVTYQNNNVYIDGAQVATADEFAQSAAALATVEPPASDEAAEQAEWLPLGTFAMSTSQSDVEPTRIVQLAVDKSGVIAGTMVNRETDRADAIQGQVDKETQRVAFRIGDSETVVAETGIYNLTQDEAPLLVHFGADKTETYVLVRLDAPEEQPEGSDGQ